MLILDGIQNSNWCRRCQAKGRLHQSENSKRQTLMGVGQTFPATLPVAIHLQYSKDSIHSNVDL